MIGYLFSQIPAVVMIILSIICSLGAADVIEDKIRNKKYIQAVVLYLLFAIIISWMMLPILPIILALRITIKQKKNNKEE